MRLFCKLGMHSWLRWSRVQQRDVVDDNNVVFTLRYQMTECGRCDVVKERLLTKDRKIV